MVMPMKNKKNTKKTLVISFLTFVFIAALFGILIKTGVIFKTSKKTPVASGPTAEQQKESNQAAADEKKQLIEDQKPGTDTAQGSTDQVKTVDLSAKQETNGNVTVFTTLHGYSSGTCSLKVTNGSKTVNQTASVIYQPEFSSCAGFSVPISSLDKGTWAITLTVTSEGQPKTKSISFEVM